VLHEGDAVAGFRVVHAPGHARGEVIFTYDPAENRRSIHKLAALEPILILPGHGPAVTDVARFQRFAGRLEP